MSLRNQERGLFTVKGLIFSLGLIASFVFVGSIYAGLLRPAIERSTLAANFGLFEDSSVPPLFILLNGYEQQICISLFMWACMILLYKAYSLRHESSALAHFTPSSEGGGKAPHFPVFESLKPLSRDDASTVSRDLDERTRSTSLQNMVLPYVLARGLERYHLTGEVQEVTETISGRLDIAAEQQESELSMLRYIAWAIPSIGFIGTVRGIGLALQRADEALEGDISGVTSALGLAFNSTLIALILSIVLMLFIHLLQANQEGLIIRLQTFCRERFIDRLKDRPEEDTTLPRKESTDEPPESDSTPPTPSPAKSSAKSKETPKTNPA